MAGPEILEMTLYKMLIYILCTAEPLKYGHLSTILNRAADLPYFMLTLQKLWAVTVGVAY